jgi:hypothetical protein
VALLACFGILRISGVASSSLISVQLARTGLLPDG